MQILLTLLFFWLTNQNPKNQANQLQHIDNKATIRAMYHLKYQLDSLNPTRKLHEDFKLLISKNQSVFFSILLPKRDSAMSKIAENIRNQNGGIISLVGVPTTRFNFSIYKSSTITTTFEKILSAHYQISETRDALKWHIGPDTQHIAGYNCRNALVDYGGRHWQAWFTSEIPVSDGPYKFGGLPGLIVRLEDAQGFFNFELTSITRLTSGPSLAFPNHTAQSISREQFCKMAYSYKLAPFSFMNTEGESISSADQQAYREKIRANNNAIERH